MKRVAAALTAAAAAGLGAAYGIYHLAFFQRPKLDIPTAEEWAQGSRFLPQIRENVEFVDSLPCDYVYITADDGTSLSARTAMRPTTRRLPSSCTATAPLRCATRWG